MMRKLDQRGVAALEFCLVAGTLFTMMFAIFDLGRFAITVHSLHALADAGARSWMICYQNSVLQSQSDTNCLGDLATNGLLSPSKMQAIAPFLYNGGLTPTLSASQVGSVATVTASQPDFTMLMPIWGKGLNAPTASTSIPL
jgi:Flp pilus assembly protein TadG